MFCTFQKMLKSSYDFAVIFITYLSEVSLANLNLLLFHRWSLRCPESPTTALHRSKASGNSFPPHADCISFQYWCVSSLDGYFTAFSWAAPFMWLHSLGLQVEAVGTDHRICAKPVGQNPWSVWLSLPSGVLAGWNLPPCFIGDLDHFLSHYLPSLFALLRK